MTLLTRLDLPYRFARWRERMVMKFVWALPHEVVKWAFMRVMANATQGPYGMDHPDSVSWGMALARWEAKP